MAFKPAHQCIYLFYSLLKTLPRCINQTHGCRIEVGSETKTYTFVIDIKVIRGPKRSEYDCKEKTEFA